MILIIRDGVVVIFRRSSLVHLRPSASRQVVVMKLLVVRLLSLARGGWLQHRRLKLGFFVFLLWLLVVFFACKLFAGMCYLT